MPNVDPLRHIPGVSFADVVRLIPKVMVADILSTAVLAVGLRCPPGAVLPVEFAQIKVPATAPADLHASHCPQQASRRASHGTPKASRARRKASARRHKNQLWGERPGSNRRPSGPQPDALT